MSQYLTYAKKPNTCYVYVYTHTYTHTNTLLKHEVYKENWDTTFISVPRSCSQEPLCVIYSTSHSRPNNL